MARARKTAPSLENIFFSTPEQKVVRFLLSEPTSTFTPRVISSKLKGIRGLGGTEGIMRILKELETLGMVEFVDNQRAVRLQDENPTVRILKTFAAICDLEGLKALLADCSARGVLFGCRADGKAATDSEYDLLVVSDAPEEVQRITESHPLGRQIVLKTVKKHDFDGFDKKEPSVAARVNRGIVLWGMSY